MTVQADTVRGKSQSDLPICQVLTLFFPATTAGMRCSASLWWCEGQNPAGKPVSAILLFDRE
jgi:hypothetical protein